MQFWIVCNSNKFAREPSLFFFDTSSLNNFKMSNFGSWRITPSTKNSLENLISLKHKSQCTRNSCGFLHLSKPKLWPGPATTSFMLVPQDLSKQWEACLIDLVFSRTLKITFKHVPNVNDTRLQARKNITKFLLYWYCGWNAFQSDKCWFLRPMDFKLQVTWKNIKHQNLLLTMIDAANGWLEFGPLLNHTEEATTKCLDKHWFCHYRDPEKSFVRIALNFSGTTSKNFLIFMVLKDSPQWLKTCKF